MNFTMNPSLTDRYITNLEETIRSMKEEKARIRKKIEELEPEINKMISIIEQNNEQIADLEDKLMCESKCVKALQDQVAELEAKLAPPFVFDGKRGKYRTDDKTVVRVTYVASYPLPLAIFPNGTWKEVNPDGTFPGGRIVGRANQ